MTACSCRARRPSNRPPWPAGCGACCSSAGSSSTRARPRSRSTASGPAGSARLGAGRVARRAAAARPADRDPSGCARRRGRRRRGAGGLGGRWRSTRGRRPGRGSGARLVTWSSYIVLTEPIPDRLADIGWTGGEGAGGRPVHAPLPADDAGRADRHRRRRRSGRVRRPDRRRRSPTTPVGRGAAAAGLRRLFPSLRDVRIEDAWGGPIDISADHLPWFGPVRDRPIHYGHGYSGNGVGPSLVGGRILAARGAGARRRPGAGPAARRRPRAAGVPARAGAVPRRAAHPRGGRRGGRPARNGATEPGSAAARAVSGSRGGSGITSGRNRRRSGIGGRREQESAKSARVSAPRRTRRARSCRSPR